MKKNISVLSALPLLSCLLLNSAMAGGAGAPPDNKSQSIPLPMSSNHTGGRFIVNFEPSKIKGMDKVVQQLKKDGIITFLLSAVDHSIKLPTNVPINFKDCGFENAFWNPETKDITFCYDLMDLYSHGYALKSVEKEEQPLLKDIDDRDIIYGTTLFVLFHELGHGLIKLYHLPTTGREEDAVDQLSTLTLLDLDKAVPANTPLKDRPGRYALLGAYFFKRIFSAPTSGISRDLFADEHNMGQQRFYDVMCLVMGSNPEVYGPLVAAGYSKVAAEVKKNPAKWNSEKIEKAFKDTDQLNILPSARADRCDVEFAQYDGSWQYFTDEFMIKGKIRK